MTDADPTADTLAALLLEVRNLLREVRERLPSPAPDGPNDPEPVGASGPDGPTRGRKARRTDGEMISTAEAARRLGIDRSTLDAWVARAPKSLPGGPVKVGDGKKRRHLLWRADAIASWVEALRAYEADRGRRGR